MQIYGPSHLHGPQAITAPHHLRHTASAPSTTGHVSDELDISETGRLLDLASQAPEIRADRVRDIRAAIAEGRYESEAKLTVALDRLLDEIG